MGVDAVPVVDDGLGNSAYLVDLGNGGALSVDATRDLRGLRREAQRRGLELAFAADTHLHADFLSGARDLAGNGARILASAAGGRLFPHQGLHEGDEVDLGGLRLRALATPGHTPEHLSFVLVDGPRALGLFTGGSLLVGAAARTDLVSPDRTEQLAREQWQSLQRLVTLPEETEVWPTRGAGSFCAAPPEAARTTTIGREKDTNPLLNAGSEQAFVEQLLAGLGSFPPYFLRLGNANRFGPRPLEHAPSLQPLTAQAVAGRMGSGAQLVDVRPVQQYADSHILGSLAIPLRDVFATWLGWTAEPNLPLVFVRADDQDPDEIIWQSLKIGYDNLAGELGGGMAAWVAAGLSTTTTALLAAGQIDGRPLIDVRQRSEYATGHVPRSSSIELGQLAEGHARQVPDGAAVMCGQGERAMTAVSLLERSGRRDLAVVVGGPGDWAADSGQQLEVDP